MEKTSWYIITIIASIFTFGTLIEFNEPVYSGGIAIAGIFGTFFLLLIYTLESEDKTKKVEGYSQ